MGDLYWSVKMSREENWFLAEEKPQEQSIVGIVGISTPQKAFCLFTMAWFLRDSFH